VSKLSSIWFLWHQAKYFQVWNDINVDIIVHAPHKGSGNLLRLLKSLNNVDFTSHSIPHLTIELPQNIEKPTKEFLEKFQWPPKRVYNPTKTQMLSLRRRIPRQRMTEEESSVKFLESFWPAHSSHCHVLVLSPQAELSPQFFHCMLYQPPG
jgi:hypothetical protein